RRAMTHLCELLGRRRPNPPRRAVGPDQFRKLRLDRAVAPLQGVVVAVRNRRRVLGVIALVVARNLARKPLQLLRGLGLGHLGDRRRLAHVARRRFGAPSLAPLIKRSAAARASSVTLAPASMRAISSRRPPASNVSTRVVIAPAAIAFAIRK